MELGCGEVPIFQNSTKIDIAKLPNIDIVHNLNDPIPLKGTYDIIIALELIGHLWNVDGFLEECQRLLKDDGAFILSSLNVKYWKTRMDLLLGDDSRFDEDGYYHWYFSPGSLVKKLRQHGFTVEFIKPIGRMPLIDLASRFICICHKAGSRRGKHIEKIKKSKRRRR